MKKQLNQLQDHKDVAEFFGLSYKVLAALIYGDDRKRYCSFDIPKKGGDVRRIDAPTKPLRAIQLQLLGELYKYVRIRPAAHGFVSTRSIITNADKHLNKKAIFNIDLSDFFGAIHFGRVRRLFMSRALSLPPEVATVLSQIVTYKNRLPQGAPTSPVISNMIAWKLDGQLQRLAQQYQGTYSRYADDITFSFTSSDVKIASEIVARKATGVEVGPILARIIEANGFKINQRKVRLASRHQRMEVTGLTVNEFRNVRRSFIRLISSRLHAWKKWGLENAQAHFHESLRKNKLHGWESEKDFAKVVCGQIQFVRSIRGERDHIFQKLAVRYNELATQRGTHFSFPSWQPRNINEALNALWVIEVCYDDEDGQVVVAQGTGFTTHGQRLITAAHVVSKSGEPFKSIAAYRWNNSDDKQVLRVLDFDDEKDLAVCKFEETIESPWAALSLSLVDPEQGETVYLLGFPDHRAGKSPNTSKTSISSTFSKGSETSMVAMFEIDQHIRGGFSGGPVVNSKGVVVGVAHKGLGIGRKEKGRKDKGLSEVTGHNEVIGAKEVSRFLRE